MMADKKLVQNLRLGFEEGEKGRYDPNKIDEAVLAVLLLTLHQDYYVWKNIDFDVMNRLYEKGYINDQKNNNKSISFTNEGLEKGREVFERLFGKES